MSEKAYTIIVKREQEVEVFAENWSDAERYVSEMVENGDACAELGDATYSRGRIRELDEDGNPVDE